MTTDLEGNFSISVAKKDAILEFSYLGYLAQKVSTKGKDNLIVTMVLDEKLLGEIVVVGYGIQEKISVTAAISQVKADEALSKAPTSNISDRIAGVIPGVISLQTSGQPGASAVPAITVRGRAAKYIVDGVQRSFDQIDPNEIETITVLKDASASAVYGLGASSVIIVTTKRGKIDEKTSISFSANYGISKTLIC